ncbi:unnamed protein product [Ambrosiozyma monospora]|uniref:Unnamed protein product n=1 Tax=Ambrosiozyma monospora TaxID=43982 RepID=A0ACB5SWS0_AMBMO|nr:unnamed protein product [Ambrosiozyma monospora]
MFRDRTNLYLAYRRTFPHHATGSFDNNNSNNPDTRFDRLREEEEGLINNRSGLSPAPFRDDPSFDDLGANDTTVGVVTLPEEIVKLQTNSELMMEQIEDEVSQLGKLYKKNLLPGFKDTSEDEQKINELSFKITKDFQLVYKEISMLNDSKLFGGDSNSDELKRSQIMLIDNLKKKLALRTQELSTQFRKLQNSYIRYLKEDEDGDTSMSTGTTLQGSNRSYSPLNEMEASSNIESYSRKAIEESRHQLSQSQTLKQQQAGISDEYIQQREREIYAIAQSVLEISTIFKNLENIVIEQGTVLDRIDYNLNNSLVQFKKADKNLNKAETYQKQTRKCKCVLLLVLLIILGIMILLVKPRRTDHYIHDGGDSGNDKSGDNNDNDSDSNAGSGSGTGSGTGSTGIDSSKNIAVADTEDVLVESTKGDVSLSDANTDKGEVIANKFNKPSSLTGEKGTAAKGTGTGTADVDQVNEYQVEDEYDDEYDADVYHILI